MLRTIGALPLVTIMLLWSAWSFAQSHGPLLHLDDVLSARAVPMEVSYSARGASPEDIAQQPADQWQVLSGSSVKPLDDDGVWLRFAVANDSDQAQQRWVVVAWPVLNHLQMHLLTPEGELRWSSPPVGENYPLAQRYLQHRNFVFPLTLEAGEVVTVYLELHANQLSVVPVEIWDHEAFAEADQLHLIILGAVFGSLAVMLFYNLSLYLILRDRAYLYYCTHVAAVSAHLLVVSGLGIYYLWDDWSWLKERAMPIFASLSFFTGALFIRQFLALRDHGGWLLAVNNVFLFAWGAILFFGAVLPLSQPFLMVMNVAALLSLLASTVTGCYLWWFKGSTSAKFYVFAWTMLNIGSAIFVLMLQGVFPMNYLTRYSQMAGVASQLVMISFALAYRINEAKLAQEKANQEALHLTRQMSEERAERLRAQIATLEVQKKLNEELEVRVQERTEQLNETMQQLERVNTELRQLSSTDPLTGVHNRRYLDEALTAECKRGNRTGQPLAIILVDIDHFKPVNDRFGHAVGDRCLQAVAEALREVAKRPGDLLARYGGEEFVFVLPDTDEAQARQVAEKSRLAVAALDLINEGQALPLTISVGVAAAVPDGEQAAVVLLKAADQALYKAKAAGRNCVVTASGFDSPRIGSDLIVSID